MNILKRVVLLFTLIWVVVANASDPVPSWGAGWKAYVVSTYCALHKEYYIPFRRDLNRRGFLSGTRFDRAFVRFTANTRLHGGPIPTDGLGVTSFQLYLSSEDFPTATPKKRIVEASLGGFKSEVNVVSNVETHIFSLEEDESTQLLGRFIKNETVDFKLTFANGDERPFKIYPSGDRTFYVWADMFQTCVQSHMKPPH